MSIPGLSHSPPLLVGRERELGTLRQHLDAAISGRGSLVLIGGEWEEATRLALAGSAARQGSFGYRSVSLAYLAMLAQLRGDGERAQWAVREWLPRGTETEPGTAWTCDVVVILQRVAATLALDAGDLVTANAWLAAHERWLAWSGAVLWRSEGQALWAQYHKQAGDLARAYQHARQALAHATEPRQPLALLAAHRLLGELDSGARRFDSAQTHLDASLAIADACAAPYERALTLMAMAELQAATGQNAAAKALVDAARTILERLGAKPALARADALVARLSASPATPARFPDGLSAREVDVLRLIATGINNQEIADQLSLSVRTVERHITNLYGKIAARGRADATAYALRHLP